MLTQPRLRKSSQEWMTHDMGFAGLGRMQMSRKEVFRGQQGIACVMEHPVFATLPCNGILPGAIVAQNLPSLVAAHVLNPQPGSMVCDMCASPGGMPSLAQPCLTQTP